MNNYQVKVNNTQQYSDSQGEHVVCRGKFLLIDPEWIGNDRQPIIISETEDIHKGDMIYDSSKRMIKEHEGESIPAGIVTSYKILALPEHFSDKHLQAIVDGKMKDGDEVYLKVESEQYDKLTFLQEQIKNAGYEKFAKKAEWRDKVIHLDQQNHITLFPAQQSLEEASKKFRDEFSTKVYNEIQPTIADVLRQRKEGFKAGAEWAVKNNYKGE